jgi:putative exporter of polyketide antibiotics
MPGALLGVRGPTGRSFGERLPMALAWGIGLALYAALIGASSRSFADELAKSPDTARLFATLFKGYDVTTGGGFLQLLFAYMGYLASPLGRARWAISGGVGVFGAIAVMTVVAMLGVAIGVASAGSDVATPVAGTLILGLYAAAAAGVGFAVGGLFRNTVAGEVTAVLVIATFLVDFLAPALSLPDWVHQVALTSHFGGTMIGNWDPAGVVACLVLAVGGLLLGAWGMTRRDVD